MNDRAQWLVENHRRILILGSPLLAKAAEECFDLAVSGGGDLETQQMLLDIAAGFEAELMRRRTHR